MLKSALRYGGYIAIICFAIFLIQTYGFHNENNVFSTIIVLIGALFALRMIRRENEGFLTYGEAFKCGYLVMFSAVVLSSAFECIIRVVDPNVIANEIQLVETAMIGKAVPDDVIVQSMDLIHTLFTPFNIFWLNFFSYGLLLVLVAAIIALFMKKNKDNPFDQEETVEDF